MAITITSPNSTVSSIIEVIYGDDYYNTDSRAITFDLTGFPSMTGATVTFRVDKITEVLSFSCTVVDTDTLRLELTSAQIETIGVGYWKYDLQAALLNTHVVTIIKDGTLLIAADIR